MSTSVLKALPGKLDIKRTSPSILYILASLAVSTSVLKAIRGKLDIKRLTKYSLCIGSNVVLAYVYSILFRHVHKIFTLIVPVSSKGSGKFAYLQTPMVGSREGGTGDPDAPHPVKNNKNIGFLSNTGQDSLKNRKATKPAFNV